MSPGQPSFLTREGIGRRAGGLALVLLLHAALGLLFLTLAPAFTGEKSADDAMIAVSVAPERPAVEPTPEVMPEPAQERPRPTPPQPAPPRPLPPAPPLIVPPPAVSTAIESVPPPAAPDRPVYGPPDLRPKPAPDSERVEGSGPNGEPLYAAAWYREPYDDELRGFLSTAQGPGWGLIACRTVPNYRVEDCVIVGESPVGSGIARSVQAAAWQFQVRPPRVGGRDRYGEWVRIRIDYRVRRDRP